MTKLRSSNIISAYGNNVYGTDRLLDLTAKSDYVSLHIPLIDETK
jgi:phosphoglycerate dehydrogenase-like enzyme